MARFAESDASEELLSRVPLDECVRRLRESADRPWNVFGGRPVIGWARRSSFRGRKRIWYGNSFQTHVVATLTTESRRTRIHCRFGLATFTRVFNAIWFSGVLIVASAFIATELIRVVKGEPIPAMESLGVVIPVMMLCLGYGMMRFGQWLARGERRFLTDFLCATLEARRVTTSDGGPIPL